jgi:ligand-binding SRPBCC domain-containing protein
MTTHRLVASQTIDRPPEAVFDFFARPQNLGRITPPAMRFEQRSTDLDMRAGLEIEHRIRPLLGIPTTWRSTIESFDPPRSFVDVQASGPYSRWRHHHRFTPVADGTRIDDEVEYELPLGPLGDVAHALLI